MTPAGWYGEPGNAALERYWDGQQWTPQTRPAAAASAATSLELGPTNWEQQESVRAARLQADLAARATQCLTPGCGAPRSAGSSWCAQHTPVAAPVQPTGRAALACPHCQVRGRIKTRTVKQKKGVSGGKATGALLTGGLSLLGTGLSRKEKATEMRCGSCNTVWYV